MKFTMPPLRKAEVTQPDTYKIDRQSWERLRKMVTDLCDMGLDRCKRWSLKHNGKIPCIQDDIEAVLDELHEVEFEMLEAAEPEYDGAIGGHRSLLEDL